MKLQYRWNNLMNLPALSKWMCFALGLVVVLTAEPSLAAVTWDSYTLSDMEQPLGSQTQWWFDPLNWSNTNPGSMAVAPFYLPPNNDTGGAATDVLINGGTSGTEVVYDPSINDPNFDAIGTTPANYPFAAGYGPQTIWRMYMGRETTDIDVNGNTGLAKLTIRGDLQTNQTAGDTRWQIGRSSGIAGVASNALIIQEGGVVINNDGDIDLGSNDSLVNSFGNGTYDYRAGTLVQGFDPEMASGEVRRFRLSAGGSTGVGGVGTFIMHNPGTDLGGHVRIRSFQVAPFGGQNGLEPNGVTNGVGIVEFHATSEGTRPVQVDEIYLGNGADTGAGDPGVRSARLRLVLDEAPIIDGNGTPADMGLFDVDWDGDGNGAIIGPGASGNSLGLTFSNADAANPLDASAVYSTDDSQNIVTAMFGASTYRWRLYYDGDIRWSDPNNSLLDLTYGDGDGIAGPGTGKDIVLIGLDSVIVSEGLQGDFNGDHIVNAADYTVWRNNLGSPEGSLLSNNGNGGTIDETDYALWKSQFGMSNGAGAGGLGVSSVPEPGSVLLTLLSLVGLVGFRRRNS
jgi:hypothetical protein